MKTVKLGQTTKILLKEGDKLFSQGDEGNSAYMIVYGHVDVLRETVCLINKVGSSA